jgi:hypothetical protein
MGVVLREWCGKRSLSFLWCGWLVRSILRYPPGGQKKASTLILHVTFRENCYQLPWSPRIGSLRDWLSTFWGARAQCSFHPQTFMFFKLSMFATDCWEWGNGWGCKNGYQKGIICLREIGLRAHNMLIILGSFVNMIGGSLYDRLNEHENLSLWQRIRYPYELRKWWGNRLWERLGWH